jgi:UDP-N-acetylmuramyl pentapeptide phosphotransferase/UDP-N-acetylglucosamine-1-phosphate transferase
MWLYAAFFGLEYWPFLLGLTLVAGISFVDDIHSLPDSVRLVVQFIAMALMFYCWGILNWESWWIIILGLILCVGITNAYNFMDGINGITGAYSLAVLLPLVYANAKAPFINMSLLVVMVLAVLVFCFFNFRKKAKCFAGDVGAVGIAFFLIFATGKLMIMQKDLTYIVFFTLYGVDTVLTICHRILLHEHLGEAHRKHAYQIMANELKMPHVLVSAIYMLLQLLVSFGLLLLPVKHWAYLCIVLSVFGIAYLLFMRRCYPLHAAYLSRNATDKKS